jgi:putative transposase
MKTITRAYKFRLYPNYDQLCAIQRHCEAATYAWNFTLSVCEGEYHQALADAGVLDLEEIERIRTSKTRGKRRQKKAVLGRAYKELKQRGIKLKTPSINRGRLYKVFCEHRDTVMLSYKQLHCHSYSYPIERVVKAYQAWWKRRVEGAPTYKRRGEHDSYTIQINNRSLGEGKIRIPGVGWVRCRRSPLSLITSGKVCSLTVSRTADRWDVSVAVRDVELEDRQRPPECRGVVGVDLGVKAIVTTVSEDGLRSVSPPRALEQNLGRLAKLQRRTRRKQRGSRRYYLAQMKVARLHASIAQQRADFLHHLSRELTKNYGRVVLEGFDIHELIAHGVGRGAGTNERKTDSRRKMSDNSWGELRRQLQYKGQWYDVDVLVRDSKEPTDQKCHSCGAINKMPSDTSRYVCESCGLETTRQENTARLLYDFGRNPPESTGGDPGPDARGPDGSAARKDSNQPGKSSGLTARGKKRERSHPEPGGGSSDGSAPFLDADGVALARNGMESARTARVPCSGGVPRDVGRS